MKLFLFYSESIDKFNCKEIEKICSQFNLEYQLFNIDNDPEILSDYNIKGNTPAFIIFDNDDNRILTHCGRFSESKIIKLLIDLKNNSNFN